MIVIVIVITMILFQLFHWMALPLEYLNINVKKKMKVLKVWFMFLEKNE